jgi:hypothetical protein
MQQQHVERRSRLAPAWTPSGFSLKNAEPIERIAAAFKILVTPRDTIKLHATIELHATMG